MTLLFERGGSNSGARQVVVSGPSCPQSRRLSQSAERRHETSGEIARILFGARLARRTHRACVPGCVDAQDAGDRPVHGCRYAQFLSKGGNSATQPRQLHPLAANKIMVHRRCHRSWKCIAEGQPILGKVWSERHTLCPSDGNSLVHDVEQESTGSGIFPDWPNGLTDSRCCCRQSDEKDVFLPDQSFNLVADIGVDAAGDTGLIEGFDPSGVGSIVFAEIMRCMVPSCRMVPGSAITAAI